MRVLSSRPTTYLRKQLPMTAQSALLPALYSMFPIWLS